MRLPIRLRLAVVSGALMAVLLAALGAFLYLRLESDLRQAVDAGLRSRAEVLVAGSASGRLPEGGGLAEADEAFAQLLAPDGRVLDSTSGLASRPLLTATAVDSVTGPGFFDADVATLEEPVPARLLAVPSGEGFMVVGVSVEDQREALGRLLVLLAAGGPVAVALASGVGWLVAGAALRPVERLRVEAEAVSGSEPGRRLPVPDTGDELAKLGRSLNRMLDRLEAAVDRERRFVGDASHELRTPLANLRAELDLALRRARTSEELAAALASAAEETERLTRLAEDLLVLARAGGGALPVRRASVNLSALVRSVVDRFAGRATERGVSLETVAGAGVQASVDEDRLRQAVGNLIDNALRYSPSGGAVTVELGRSDGILSIEVTDTGEGFDPAFLSRAFEPFSRADPSRSRGAGGAGLGLAIVRAVAEAHGGSVEAANRPDGGAVVVLRIPG
jgi:heavy metal sensor kinase